MLQMELFHWHPEGLDQRGALRYNIYYRFSPSQAEEGLGLAQ